MITKPNKTAEQTTPTRHRGCIESAVLVGLAACCLFLVHSISTIINGTLSGSTKSKLGDNGDLALAVIELTHTMETMQEKVDQVQQTLVDTGTSVAGLRGASTTSTEDTKMDLLGQKMDQMQQSLDSLAGGTTIVSTGSTTIDTISASVPSSPEDTAALTKLLAEKNPQTGQPHKILYYTLGAKERAGFGSLINNMLYIGSYQRMSKGRQIVVDEYDQPLYRKDETHGMITAYFDTNFPVVSSLAQREIIRQQFGRQFYELPLYNNEAGDAHHQIVQVITHDMYSFDKARAEAGKFYSGPGKIHQFYTLTTDYCHNMKINAQTQQTIRSMLEKASIPDFAALQNSPSPIPITVAMHVRRGDKAREVKHTPSKAYIQKLEQVLNDNNLHPSELKHCFVATDDYQAFVEVQTEMANSPTLAHCQMHTLATPMTTSSSNPESNQERNANNLLTLLAELKVMMEATFFIGTWTSNIGIATTYFRGCNHPAVKGRGVPPVGQEYNILTQDQVASRLDHFYRSYGLEGEEPYLML